MDTQQQKIRTEKEKDELWTLAQNELRVCISRLNTLNQIVHDPSRELSIAIINLEAGQMWLNKAFSIVKFLAS